MNKCKQCNIWVADDTMICPLCHRVLSEEKEEKRKRIEPVGYPDIKEKVKRFQKAGRILCFVALALEVMMIFINYLTFSAIPKYWSIIFGAVLFYVTITLWDLVRRRQGHIRKIYMHIFNVLALLVLIDVVLGWKGWSLEFGLPCIIYSLVLVIITCMIVNSSSWHNYILMQLAAILLSVIDVVLHFAGFFHHIVLAWIALGISVLLWSGTMIIGDKKAKNELKRKLHI